MDFIWYTVKDKRYNNYLDNYMSKYEDLFKLGLVILAIGLICYGVNELYKWFIL